MAAGSDSGAAYDLDYFLAMASAHVGCNGVGEPHELEFIQFIRANADNADRPDLITGKAHRSQ